MVPFLNEWNNEIQRAIAHPIKRGIIELLRDAKLSFTELYNAVGNGDDHGRFGYHLRTLNGFVEFEQSTQKYRLTHRGRLLDAVIRDFRFITQTTRRELRKYVQYLEFGDHAIGFYEDDYLKRIMSFPFIKAGLLNGEAVMYLVSEQKIDSEIREIQKNGLNLENLHKESFTIMPAYEWYLEKGKGQAKTIIDNWMTLLKKKQKAGFKGLHVVGEMEDFLNYAKSKECLRYEEALGRHFTSNLCAICLYDTHRLDTEQFTHLSKSHGHTISKDIVGQSIM